MSRPVPLLLLHGYDGSPQNWLQSGFVRALVEQGADPGLIRLFHYGWQAGEYNSQADIRQLAARLVRRETGEAAALHSQIARLSEASLQRGGPSEVTLVAHSMGGLIARYYLSRRTPDEWGTVNEGLVSHLITIATPHLGLKFTRVTHLVEPDSFIVRLLSWLERLPFVKGCPAQELRALNAAVEALQWEAERDEVRSQGFFDSPAVRQMVPGSEFLTALNEPGSFPDQVRSDLIWGDVQVGGTVRWGPTTLWSRTVSLGDLLIPAYSASNLPPAQPMRHPFLWRRHYEIQVNEPTLEAYNLNDFLPPISHSNLLRNPEIQALVARLVGLGSERDREDLPQREVKPGEEGTEGGEGAGGGIADGGVVDGIG